MSRTSPFNRHFIREQKRAAILSEAAALFNVHGARATRLGDVAARLDLNPSSLYYYVDSKDELIYLTYLESCDTIGAMLDRAEAAGGGGADRIAAFVRLYFEAWQAVARGERPHFAILTEIHGLRADHRAEIAGRYLALFGRILGFIEKGQADRSLLADPPRDVALAVFGLVQMTVLWVHKLEPGQYGAAAEAFVDILLHGVAADRGACGAGASAGNMAGSFAAAAPGEKPAAFCSVACDYFNRKGFKGTSLDEIAERLDVSKGSFYHHVRDKDDLLRQCFQRSLAQISEAQARAARAPGSGLDRLMACALELFTVQNSAGGPLIRFNLIPSLAPRHQAAFREELAQVSAAFGRFIGEGISDGSLRAVDPLVAEQMLLTGIDVSADLRRLRPTAGLDEAFNSYFGFYFRGLARAAR